MTKPRHSNSQLSAATSDNL